MAFIRRPLIRSGRKPSNLIGGRCNLCWIVIMSLAIRGIVCNCSVPISSDALIEWRTLNALRSQPANLQDANERPSLFSGVFQRFLLLLALYYLKDMLEGTTG